jgi:hypothetical protein
LTTPLSPLGERVARDGAFISWRGSGERGRFRAFTVNDTAEKDAVEKRTEA